MKSVTLYTKLDCHLCEEAYQILLDLTDEMPLRINIVDIGLSRNPAVASRYSQRIPVLVRPDSRAELDWPFTTGQVRAFLED